MRRTFYGVVAAAAVALVFAFPAAAAPSGVTSNGFETNTAGWFTFGSNSIDQRDGSYVNPSGYADPINAADGSYYAGLGRGSCAYDVPQGGIGPSVNCPGPYTDWGNLNNYTWNGPYTTQVDIYLDAGYAALHPDTDQGNLNLIPGPTGSGEYGTRFDYTSAINSSTPDSNGDAQHLRDFGFNVSTGYADDGCDGFMVTGQTVVDRNNANPNIDNYGRTCVSGSGWYTFKHSFSSENGYLDVLMQIIRKSDSAVVASWDITGIDADGTYGCNRYGWFADQEIYGLPIDNASITGGCAAPTITGGQITPTGTTCTAYNAGTAATLGTVQYTLKNGAINSVSPGVFFYYGKIAGTVGQTFTITQTNNGGAPQIPVQHTQVILYDTNCNVVKWSPDSDAGGVVTGTLPSTGTFIISVKYDPGALKGTALSGTVTYTIDGTTVNLAPKK